MDISDVAVVLIDDECFHRRKGSSKISLFFITLKTFTRKTPEPVSTNKRALQLYNIGDILHTLTTWVMFSPQSSYLSVSEFCSVYGAHLLYLGNFMLVISKFTFITSV